MAPRRICLVPEDDVWLGVWTEEEPDGLAELVRLFAVTWRALPEDVLEHMRRPIEGSDDTPLDCVAWLGEEDMLDGFIGICHGFPGTEQTLEFSASKFGALGDYARFAVTAHELAHCYDKTRAPREEFEFLDYEDLEREAARLLRGWVKDGLVKRIEARLGRKLKVGRKKADMNLGVVTYFGPRGLAEPWVSGKSE